MREHTSTVPLWRPWWAGLIAAIMGAVAAGFAVLYVSLILKPSPYWFFAAAVLSPALLSASAVTVLVAMFLRRGGLRLFYAVLIVGLLAAGLGYAILRGS